MPPSFFFLLGIIIDHVPLIIYSIGKAGMREVATNYASISVQGLPGVGVAT